jgi:2-keto-4-pentenoate hydratase/2-oxohepta-3-ene-1,7-dioic acid hydratase in catechol pathway
VRIARLQTGDGPRFAVARDEEWALLPPSLGDTPSLIASILTPTGETLPQDAELLCPVVAPTKVIAIGLNYLDHIRETAASRPKQPVVFAKFPNALAGPRDTVLVDPDLTNEADYEIELAVVIGRPCRAATSASALDHIFGYAIGNDLSPRDLQRTDPQLSWAKSVDGFCPVGPWITTADDVLDPQSLAIRSFVNGESRQSSSTSEMLFPVADLIAFLSRTMTLMAGDVILTGTPHGVGFTMSPPRFLREGDIVRGEIEGLGYLENAITSTVKTGASSR